MTIQELSDLLHSSRKEYEITQEMLLRYVNVIESKIYEEIISKHYTTLYPAFPDDRRGDNPLDLPPARCVRVYDLPPAFVKYTVADIPTRELIAPMPYDELYPAYVKYRIALEQDDSNVNNTELLYRQAYEEFRSWYSVHHMPITHAMRSRRTPV